MFQTIEFLRIVALQLEDRLKSIDRFRADPPFEQFGPHVVDPHLFELIDGHRDLDHLVRMSDRFGNAVQDFTVIHLKRNTNSKLAENPFHDLHKLHFVQQRARPDHIDVTLVKLAVTPFLGPVGPPDRLNLVTLERKDDFALMLHHITGQRHRQVVPQPFLANARGGAQCVVAQPGGIVPRIENFEQELVPFVAVFAQQRRKIFHCGRFERCEAEGAEHRTNGIEDIIAAHHLLGGKVARAFGYGGFLCHYRVYFAFICRY